MTWLQTAWKKWRVREMLCKLLSETYRIDLSRSVAKTSASVDELWRCTMATKNLILAWFSAAGWICFLKYCTNFQNTCPHQSHTHTWDNRAQFEKYLSSPLTMYGCYVLDVDDVSQVTWSQVTYGFWLLVANRWTRCCWKVVESNPAFKAVSEANIENISHHIGDLIYALLFK